MSTRASKETQKWNCPICKKVTVFKVISPPKKLANSKFGYRREHECKHCLKTIETAQVTIIEFLTLRAERDKLQRENALIEKQLEAFRLMKSRILLELQKTP